MLLVVKSINSFVVSFSRRLESCLRVTASVALPQIMLQVPAQRLLCSDRRNLGLQ